MPSVQRALPGLSQDGANMISLPLSILSICISQQSPDQDQDAHSIMSVTCLSKGGRPVWATGLRPWSVLSFQTLRILGQGCVQFSCPLPSYRIRQEMTKTSLSHYLLSLWINVPGASINRWATFHAGQTPPTLNSVGARLVVRKRRWREKRGNSACLSSDVQWGLSVGRRAGQGYLFWEWLILVQMYILNLLCNCVNEESAALLRTAGPDSGVIDSHWKCSKHGIPAPNTHASRNPWSLRLPGRWAQE